MSSEDIEQPVSDAEKVVSVLVSEAEKTESATGTVKVKKHATPKQLEALRLARMRKSEKAATRKAEYQKFVEKVSVEQSSSSDSEVEYVIKRVRTKGSTRNQRKVTEPQTPPVNDGRKREEASEDDETRVATNSPAPREMSLHFV